MSKNHDRYKEDYINLIENVEELDEIETQKFEKFRPKKKNPSKLNLRVLGFKLD
jgi:hypothetical protein